MKILFSGGGSGGHLFPGVAVAEELKRRDPFCRPVFAGSDREIETRIFRANGFEHIPLAVSPSSAFLKNPLSSVVTNWRAYRSAGHVVDRVLPNVVVGLGGFASIPVVLAAWRRSIPVVLMEQNAVLGRANRLLLPLARRICLSYSETRLPKRYQRRVHVTGNPVRGEIVNSVTNATERDTNSKTLLILGGSQGALAVNEAVLNALPLMRSELRGWRIVHQTGSPNFSVVENAYSRLGIAAEVSPFFTEIASIYARADLVLARAGGTTLAELAVHHLPAVLIPYPGSLRDHQQQNAQRYAGTGGAIMLTQSPQTETTARTLSECLKPLLTDSKRGERMRSGMRSLARPQAAGEVADVIVHCRETRPAIPLDNSKTTRVEQTKSA